jgi:hypothetical protein
MAPGPADLAEHSFASILVLGSTSRANTRSLNALSRLVTNSSPESATLRTPLPTMRSSGRTGSATSTAPGDRRSPKSSSVCPAGPPLSRRGDRSQVPPNGECVPSTARTALTIRSIRHIRPPAATNTRDQYLYSRPAIRTMPRMLSPPSLWIMVPVTPGARSREARNA